MNFKTLRPEGRIGDGKQHFCLAIAAEFFDRSV